MQALVAANISYRLANFYSLDPIVRFLYFAYHTACYLLVKVFGLSAVLAIIDCHANRCID